MVLGNKQKLRNFLWSVNHNLYAGLQAEAKKEVKKIYKFSKIDNKQYKSKDKKKTRVDSLLRAIEDSQVYDSYTTNPNLLEVAKASKSHVDLHGRKVTFVSPMLEKMREIASHVKV